MPIIFSGTARPRISSYSSMIGLLVTIGAGFILIPAYEMNGVAITASLSFCASALYLVYMILKEPDASLHKLLPQSSDGKKMMEFIHRKR